MKKNKKILVIIIVIIIVAVVGVCIASFLIYKNKKENDVNMEDTQSTRLIYCQKNNNESIVGVNDISYKVEEKYIFDVSSDNKMSPNVYDINLFFENSHDLNEYYNYAIENLNLDASSLSKDESKLCLTYSREVLQGGYEYYDENYLKELENLGYSCIEFVK